MILLLPYANSTILLSSHFSIRISSNGSEVSIRDVGSSNGTKINNTKIIKKRSVCLPMICYAPTST